MTKSLMRSALTPVMWGWSGPAPKWDQPRENPTLREPVGQARSGHGTLELAPRRHVPGLACFCVVQPVIDTALSNFSKMSIDQSKIRKDVSKVWDGGPRSL